MRTETRLSSRGLQRILPLRVPNSLVLLAAGLFAATMLAAQTPSRHPPTTTAHPVPRRHVHTSRAHRSRTPAPVAATVPPPAPVLPDWPIDKSPKPATITWDSKGLSIDASNSSLDQILNDVSAATGVKVEGFGADQRIFGDFGPGTARDVLSQLLQGSGYNILMMGDRGEGLPREIVLTLPQAAHNAPAAAAQSNNDDSAGTDIDDRLQPQPMEPAMPPDIAPNGPPRTPQQIMQEMQERQQQMGQRPTPQNQ